MGSQLGGGVESRVGADVPKPIRYMPSSPLPGAEFLNRFDRAQLKALGDNFAANLGSYPSLMPSYLGGGMQTGASGLQVNTWQRQMEAAGYPAVKMTGPRVSQTAEPAIRAHRQPPAGYRLGLKPYLDEKFGTPK